MNTQHRTRRLAALILAAAGLSVSGQVTVSSTFVEGGGTNALGTTTEAEFNGSYTAPETLSSFKTTVANAAATGNGGVITFDVGGDVVSTGGFFGTYATNNTTNIVDGNSNNNAADFNSNFQPIAPGIGPNNTFFLFEAPTGQSITHVEFIASLDDGTPWFTGIDNLSFTTSAIPGPSVALLRVPLWP